MSIRTAFLALAVAAIHVNAAPFTSTLARRLIEGLDQLGVSAACQDSVTNLISSPASDCLNIPGTVAILSTVEGSSWVPPTNAWLSDFCAAPTCTNEALSATIQTVVTACSAELSGIGVTQDTIIQYALEYYPIAKQAVCLRDSSNDNDLCVISTLENLEAASGQDLSPATAEAHYQLLIDNDFALARELSCTPCASAGFALVRPALPEQFLSTIDSFVGTQCGVDFLSPPSGNISVVTGTQAALAASATGEPSSASSHMYPMWLGSATAFAAYLAIAF